MSERLSVIFINPGSRQEVYQELANGVTAVEPPVWAGMLATFCRQRGHTVEILDAEALQLTPSQAATEVAARNPRLAVMVVYGHQPSASTQCMTAAGASLRAIRSAAPRTRTLIVGGHVSALPERTLREEEVDFVCQGEGPSTIASLLALLEANDMEKLASVPGLWWRDGLAVRANAPAPNVDDLDRDLPGVAWDLLPMDRYRAHNWHCFDDIAHREPYASLYTSLGCPFKCTFCCINAPFGRAGIRYHSPDQVIREIDQLVVRYGIRNLKIVDEMFVLKKAHVEGICDRIIARGYDLNIWAYARIDTVQSGLLEKMRRAGFRWLALGIESGSEHVRDGAEKSFDAEDITRVVREIQFAGIHVIGNYIFGLPDDDHRTMRETLDLALELNCEFANFYAAMAYPGSPLYAMALRERWELPKSWHAYSQHAYDTLPLPTRHVTASEVLRFRDDAFHTYFSSPAYLGLVDRKFGSTTRVHVREMSGHRLRRANA
jgi:anaerobic magnesium-protoporphyrin IX monomethyl ester cyclase